MNHNIAFQRIVLVDDSDNDNFFHGLALRKAGFGGEILVYENGETALDFLLLDQITVSTAVFLDINMPGMNGFEVAHGLSERLRPKAAFQLNMLTSSAWSVDRAAAHANGLIRNYLVKPLTPAMAAGLITWQEGALQDT